MWSRIKPLLLSSTAQSTYLTSGADIGMAGMAAITTALIARQLPPEQFGIFIVVWTILNLISGTLDFGIGAGIINFVARQTSTVDRWPFISTGYWFLSVIGLSTIVLVVVSVGWIQKIVLPNVPATWIIWATIGAGLLLLSKYLNDVMRASEQFGKAAAMTSIYGVSRLTILLWLIYQGDLTLPIAVTVICWSPVIYLVLGHLLIHIPWRQFVYDRKILQELVNFSGWLGVNQVLSTLSNRADVLLLNRLAGATSAGYYGTAGLMVKIWMILTGSLSAVFAPRLLRFGKRPQQKLFLTKVLFLVISTWIPIFALALVAKPLTSIIFGDAYLPALLAFYWLSAAVAILIATIPVTLPVIYLLKRPDIIGWLSIVQLLVTVAGNFLLIPRFDISAPGIVLLINQLIVFAVCSWWTYRWWTAYDGVNEKAH